MYLADYHTHSFFSFDSEESLANICQAALAANLTELCLTDHLDLYSKKPYTYMLDCPNWYKTLKETQEAVKNKLTLKIGIELGQPQNNPIEAAKFLRTYPLDFVIGSIHNLANDFDLYYFDFSNGDKINLFQEYLDAIFELVKNYDFDVLGHLTYPLRYMVEKANYHLDLTPFLATIRNIFTTLIQRGKGIEVNTSGYSQKLNDTLPPFELIKLYRELGGKIITLGSDAHTATAIGKQIHQGQELLQAAGFTYFSVFTDRKVDFIKL